MRRAAAPSAVAAHATALPRRFAPRLPAAPVPAAARMGRPMLLRPAPSRALHLTAPRVRVAHRRFATEAAQPNAPQGAQQTGAPEQQPQQQAQASGQSQLVYDMNYGPLDPAVPEDAAILAEIRDKKPFNPHVTFKRTLERIRPGAPDEVKSAYMWVVMYVPEELQQLVLKAMTARAEGKADEAAKLENEFNALAAALPPPTTWSRIKAFWRHTSNQRRRHLLWDEVLLREDMCDPAKREEILAGKHASWVRTMLGADNKPPAATQAQAQTKPQTGADAGAQSTQTQTAAEALKEEAGKAAGAKGDQAADAAKKL